MISHRYLLNIVLMWRNDHIKWHISLLLDTNLTLHVGYVWNVYDWLLRRYLLWWLIICRSQSWIFWYTLRWWSDIELKLLLITYKMILSHRYYRYFTYWVCMWVNTWLLHTIHILRSILNSRLGHRLNIF